MRHALIAAILLNLTSWAAYRVQRQAAGALVEDTRSLVNGNAQTGWMTFVAIAWGLAFVALLIAFLLGMRERPWPRLLAFVACAVQAAPLAWCFILTH